MVLNIILSLFSFLIILPVMSLSFLDVKNLYFLLVFSYIIYQKIIKTDNAAYKETIQLKNLIIANITDVLLLGIVCVIIKTLFDYFTVLKSINIVYVCLILLLQRQIFIPSFGFRLMKIKISNDTFVKKIKILIMNFLYLSPIYILFLNNKIHLQKQILDIFFLLLLLINLTNLFVRYFITKSNSLYEILLKVRTNSKEEFEDTKIKNIKEN